MAVFHFCLQLIPEVVARTRPAEPLTKEEIEGGSDPRTGWWSTLQLSQETLDALRGLLPVESSWGVEEFTDGQDAGSDLRLWKTEGEATVCAVTFRFSSVTEDWRLLDAFLEIARQADCRLVEERTGAVLPPDAQAVRAAYVGSFARRARTDPARAIAEAAEALERRRG